MHKPSGYLESSTLKSIHIHFLIWLIFAIVRFLHTFTLFPHKQIFFLFSSWLLAHFGLVSGDQPLEVFLGIFHTDGVTVQCMMILYNAMYRDSVQVYIHSSLTPQTESHIFSWFSNIFWPIVKKVSKAFLRSKYANKNFSSRQFLLMYLFKGSKCS